MKIRSELRSNNEAHRSNLSSRDIGMGCAIAVI
jgi:hypothetical protein